MTSTSTAASTLTTAPAPTKVQRIGQIVELSGAAVFLTGAVLSLHHAAIAVFFIGGAAAVWVGRKLHNS